MGKVEIPEKTTKLKLTPSVEPFSLSHLLGVKLSSVEKTSHVSLALIVPVSSPTAQSVEIHKACKMILSGV